MLFDLRISPNSTPVAYNPSVWVATLQGIIVSLLLLLKGLIVSLLLLLLKGLIVSLLLKVLQGLTVSVLLLLLKSP